MAENSSISLSTKIKCLIDMALNNEISWLTLNSLINNLAPTLEKSKEIIKIILKEFQEFQSKQSQNDNQREQAESSPKQDEYQGSFNDSFGNGVDEDDLEQDIIEGVGNIESENEDELVEFESKYVPITMYNFIEMNNKTDQVDEDFDVKNQPSEDLGQNQVPEDSDQIDFELVNHESSSYLSEMNHIEDESDKTMKAEVIKLKTLPMKNHKMYQCKFCPKDFKQSSNLKVHERRIHTGEKPFQCNECQKQFSDSTMLDRHSRIHSGLKPFQCETCNKCFNDVGNLNRHKRIHTAEKPYECEKCGRCFRELDQLKAHERIQNSCLELLERNNRKNYCDVCQKTFHSADYLKRHVKIHLDLKPHKCKTCGKCFREQNHLKIHERIHTDEKPFKCQICAKSFRQSSNLKEHTKQCGA